MVILDLVLSSSLLALRQTEVEGVAHTPTIIEVDGNGKQYQSDNDECDKHGGLLRLLRHTIVKCLWFVLLALIVSCAPYPFLYQTEATDHHLISVAPIYLDETWTDAERVQLHAAIDQWNEALNGTIILQVEEEHYHWQESTPRNKLILRPVSEREANRQEQYIALAWTYGRGYGGIGGNRIYFARSRFAPEDLRYIALHELGHSLGADHQKGGLMNPNYDRPTYQCIDQRTLQQVAEYRHLDIKVLKGCQ